MNLAAKVLNFLRPKAFDPLADIDLNKVVGWHSIGGSSSYGFYKDNQYENGYPSISKLGNSFAVVEPYTIDANGKSVSSNILDRLYTPNTQMSAYDFREALAVTTLVQDKVRLRVHHNGTRVTADSITGFTFMEGFTERIVGGRRDYLMPNGEVLTDDEVITLRSINPDNINSGFSASRAARRWTRLDDYIADYQKGFFENGAVPAGEMIITARTTGEFNDIVDMLQSKHKGAGKNNNITYVHRPTDQNGAPLNSQIEWVPFSSPNKDMALKDLFENVNKKIDSVYGVPAEIRGFLSNSNYASVAVAERVFVKYALDPLTMKIWSKFTHELNRITGGTGVAITYDLPKPKIADEEKVTAEAKEIDARTVSTLVAEGYTLDSAIEYINSGELYSLVLGEAPQTDKPEVLSTEEAKGTPEQPIDMYAKFYKDLADIKALLTVQPKVIEKKPEVKEKQIGPVDLVMFIDKMKRVIREQMARQVDKAVEKLDEALVKKAYGDTTEEEDKEFTKAMAALLLPLIAIYGNRTVNNATGLILEAGLSTQNVRSFEFTPAQKRAYEKYLGKVGTGYANQTAAEIRRILGDGILNGATKQEIESQLRKTLLGGPHDYRIERLAKTEVNLSEGRAGLYAMENIQEQTGYSIAKVWNVSSSDPCEFCEALDGTVISVEEHFVDKGDVIEGVSGGIYNNDFSDTDTADAHPNCNCYTTYRVERG